MKLPELKDPVEKWHEWLEASYPFTEQWARHLRTRMPDKRAPVGTEKELDDLRGLIDRSQAVDFAQLWVKINPTEAKRIRLGFKAPTVEIEPVQHWNDPETEDEFRF